MFFNYFGNNDAVVRALRLSLKKIPASTEDTFPNMWCEVLDQMLSGWYSSRSFYEVMVNGKSVELLKKYYDEPALLEMWIDNFAHKHYTDKTKYPEYLSDYMIDELAELVAEGLYGEDLYDLDEEIRKGERALKARDRRSINKIKL